MSYFSGLSEESIIQNNLDVPNNFFWKELLRNEGKNIGRLDSRYLGIDKKEVGIRPDYSAELTSWLHSFTPAINHYIKKELKFTTDIKYNMFDVTAGSNRTVESAHQSVGCAGYGYLLCKPICCIFGFVFLMILF